MRTTNCDHKNAFTLAEVLITLVIIGIIATVTIPTLVQNQKKHITSLRLKKFYNTMQQVIRLSEIDNRVCKYWEAPKETRDESGNYDYDKNHNLTYNFLKKYITPYMNYTQLTEGSYTPATETEDEIVESVTLYLNDGSTIGFNLGSCVDFNYDVNGASPPNNAGQDVFLFLFCFPPQPAARLGFQPYNKYKYPSRESALEACKTGAHLCSVLLQYDNWEFKDDYPYKL